jgi:anti-sigma-K factor RskA
MRFRDPHVHTLAGAFAMDALPSTERARFERHLARCPDCAREVAGLHETTARLAAASALAPPAALKQRVMAAAAATRQPAPGPEPRAAGTWAWRSRPRRLLTATAAAVVLVVAGIAVMFGVSAGSMHDQLSRAQDSSTQIAAVLTARDAAMMTGAVRGGGTVTVVASPSRAALVFSATGLPALPAARGYELWLVGPAGDRPAGMLPPARHGMTGPVVAAGLQPGDHLALTAEPSAGASRPTAPMMLDLVLLSSIPAGRVRRWDDDLRRPPMRYMLIHCIDEAEEQERGGVPAPGAPSIGSWLAEMDGRGVRLHGERLRYVSDATTVQVRGHEVMVSDGPFAETREQIAGYDVIDCADLDEAIEVASKHPAAWQGTIEVRPVAGRHCGDIVPVPGA